MARIRTIKPEFFRHERLYQAEQDTGLPLRLAFAGLWTAADREGRFKWRPRELKLDVIPYDPIDFVSVLDALVAAGFVSRYCADGQELGSIPSWHKHQFINNREAASTLPAPPKPDQNGRTAELERPIPDATATRAAHVPVASGTRLEHAQGEGKGREGKGKEGEIVSPKARPAPAKKQKTLIPDDFAVSERVKAWAAPQNYGDLDAHLEAFKTKCAAKGYTNIDWDAAFMGAVREDWAKLRGDGARAAQPARRTALHADDLIGAAP